MMDPGGVELGCAGSPRILILLSKTKKFEEGKSFSPRVPEALNQLPGRSHR